MASKINDIVYLGGGASKEANTKIQFMVENA